MNEVDIKLPTKKSLLFGISKYETIQEGNIKNMYNYNIVK